MYPRPLFYSRKIPRYLEKSLYGARQRAKEFWEIHCEQSQSKSMDNLAVTKHLEVVMHLIP